MNIALQSANIAVPPASDFPRIYDGVERRGKPRIEIPFPSTVHGVDATGERFAIETVLDNISSSGLYLRLRQRIEPGATLFVIASLSNTQRLDRQPLRVAMHGVVLRAELKPDGQGGVAMVFSHYRFL